MGAPRKGGDTMKEKPTIDYDRLLVLILIVIVLLLLSK